MAHWLFKEEPSHYSYADLERDGVTEWDGVRNPTALQNIRAMRVGEECYFYHSGTERAVRGIVQVSGSPHPDPNDAKSWSVPIRPVRPLERPVPLASLRALKAFARFDLLRIGRLSVVPIPELLWARILSLGGTTEDPGPVARTRRARQR